MRLLESTVVMTTRKLYDSDAKGGVKDYITVFEAQLFITNCKCIITYSFKSGYEVQHCILAKLGELIA